MFDHASRILCPECNTICWKKLVPGAHQSSIGGMEFFFGRPFGFVGDLSAVPEAKICRFHFMRRFLNLFFIITMNQFCGFCIVSFIWFRLFIEKEFSSRRLSDNWLAREHRRLADKLARAYDWRQFPFDAILQ